MKATLEYDLDDIDDKAAHFRAIKSLDMSCCLFEIFHNTKKGLEWALDGKEIDKYETLDLVYDKLYEILNNNNINLDEVC